MPFFSVIIPVYNKEKFIKNTLKCVFDQTYIDYEIIIVNDGSTDNSQNVISKFDDARILYFSQENAGVAKARNVGLKNASGQFICFLDADDYWYPTFLETLHHYIIQFPNEKVFSTAFEIETATRSFPAAYSFKKTGDFERLNFFDSSKKEAVIWTSSVAIHQEVVKAVGYFDERLKISEDTDYWIRIGLKYDIVFIWKILARYGFDNDSISRSDSYIFEDYFFEKHASFEILNKPLKSYMDFNRFATVIKYKIINQPKNAKRIRAQINMKNLTLKRQLLLFLPSYILKGLIHLKMFLTEKGYGKSIFK